MSVLVFSWRYVRSGGDMCGLDRGRPSVPPLRFKQTALITGTVPFIRHASRATCPYTLFRCATSPLLPARRSSGPLISYPRQAGKRMERTPLKGQPSPFLFPDQITLHPDGTACRCTSSRRGRFLRKTRRFAPSRAFRGALVPPGGPPPLSQGTEDFTSHQGGTAYRYISSTSGRNRRGRGRCGRS